MIIKSFEIFKFQIPLKFPLKIANKELTFRDGLILRISDESDNIGVGEISPLPGLHKENLSLTIDQIKKISSKILNSKIPKNIEQFKGGFESWLKIFKFYPSVQFGFESAVLSLLSMDQGKSAFEFFHSSNNSIKINALLSGTLQQIIEKTNQYLAEGFTTFKLKVGRTSVDEDIMMVNTINSIIDGKAKLRLDANQAWTLDESLHFFQNIDFVNLEHIEEPLKNFDELPELLKIKNIPIALDENILEIIDYQLLSPSQIKAIVIKPTVIGGVEKSIRLIKHVEGNGIKPVISDTFQSGVGLSTLIAIAHYIKSDTAMGFDTYSWLKEDILKERLEFQKNKIFIQNLPNIVNNIDYSILTKI
jgi:o-succinylbenzoate synthase